MKTIDQPKYLGFAFLFTIVMAVFGGFLSIEGMKEWYPSLVKPFEIPLWLFSIVQVIYYCICIVVIYRLLSIVAESRVKKLSISAFLFMMIFAESWNYFFLSLQSVSIGFWSMLVFFVLVSTVILILRKVERVSYMIMIPYLIWLFFDVTWLYTMWQANS